VLLQITFSEGIGRMEEKEVLSKKARLKRHDIV
jgi:hypothetical protein